MFNETLKEIFVPNLSIYNSFSLPQHWLNELYKLKFFKLFIPQKLSGLELDLSSGLKILIDTASINGSLGWVINLGAGAGYFAGLFDEDTAKEIFSDEKGVIAGSSKVGGRAQKIQGKYIVNGQWEMCTGSAHAKYFTANVFFDDKKIKSVLFFRNQVKIHEDWKLFALKASSTFNIEVKSAVIEERFTFKYDEQKSFLEYPLYRIPFFSFAKFCMVSSLIGMAEGLVNSINKEFELEENEKRYFTEFTEKINDEKKNLLSTADQFYEKANKNEKILIVDQNKLSNSISKVRDIIYRMACDIFGMLELKIADETTNTHFAWRDVILVSQHFLLR